MNLWTLIMIELVTLKICICIPRPYFILFLNLWKSQQNTSFVLEIILLVTFLLVLKSLLSIYARKLSM